LEGCPDYFTPEQNEMLVRWANKAVKILGYSIEAINRDEFRDIMLTIEEQDIAHQFGWDFENLTHEQGLIIARNILRRVNGYNGPLDFKLKKVGVEWQYSNDENHDTDSVYSNDWIGEITPEQMENSEFHVNSNQNVKSRRSIIVGALRSMASNRYLDPDQNENSDFDVNPDNNVNFTVNQNVTPNSNDLDSEDELPSVMSPSNIFEPLTTFVDVHEYDPDVQRSTGISRPKLHILEQCLKSNSVRNECRIKGYQRQA
jgi:hypothetical protein